MWLTIVTKSAKVCICLSNVLVVYLFYSECSCFVIMSESIRNGSKVRQCIMYLSTDMLYKKVKVILGLIKRENLIVVIVAKRE